MPAPLPITVRRLNRRDDGDDGLRARPGSPSTIDNVSVAPHPAQYAGPCGQARKTTAACDRSHTGQMHVRIEADDVPGAECGPGPDWPDGHPNVHVAVQRRNKPSELYGSREGRRHERDVGSRMHF